MKKFIPLLNILSVCFLATLYVVINFGNCSCEEARRVKGDIHIKSETLYGYRFGDKITFDGSVEATTESMKLETKKMDVFFNQSRKAKTIHAIGDVEVKKDDMDIFSDEAWYFMEEEKIVFVGNAEVIEGSNFVSGDKITYFTKDGRVLIERGIVSLRKEQAERQPATNGQDKEKLSKKSETEKGKPEDKKQKSSEQELTEKQKETARFAEESEADSEFFEKGAIDEDREEVETLEKKPGHGHVAKIEQQKDQLKEEKPEEIKAAKKYEGYEYKEEQQEITELAGKEIKAENSLAAIEKKDKREPEKKPQGDKQATQTAMITPRLDKRHALHDSLVFKGHKDAVYSVAFSPDSKLIASAGRDKTILIMNLQGTLATPPIIGHSDAIYGVVFSPDGKLVASGSGGINHDNTLRLWTLNGKPAASPFQVGNTGVTAVAFSLDGRLIATATGNVMLGGKGIVQLWDIEGHPFGPPFKGHSDIVYSIAFSPDNQTIATASWDKTIRLWDIQGNSPAISLKGHEEAVYAVAFSPDGKYLVSGSRDKTVRLWNSNGSVRGTPFTAHTDTVCSVAFSPDGQIIASGSWDKTIRLWNIYGQEISAPLQGHTDVVSSVAFAPAGQWLASGSWDKTVRLWALK